MRLLEWVRDNPKWVGWIGTVLGLAILGLILLGLSWLGEVWPERLIPWVPVERL